MKPPIKPSLERKTGAEAPVDELCYQTTELVQWTHLTWNIQLPPQLQWMKKWKTQTWHSMFWFRPQEGINRLQNMNTCGSNGVHQLFEKQVQVDCGAW